MKKKLIKFIALDLLFFIIFASVWYINRITAEPKHLTYLFVMILFGILTLLFVYIYPIIFFSFSVDKSYLSYSLLLSLELLLSANLILVTADERKILFYPAICLLFPAIIILRRYSDVAAISLSMPAHIYVLYIYSRIIPYIIGTFYFYFISALLLAITILLIVVLSKSKNKSSYLLDLNQGVYLFYFQSLTMLEIAKFIDLRIVRAVQELW